METTKEQTLANEQTVAIGSCQYPGSFFDNNYAYQAWRQLTDDNGDLRAQTMILLGDQIYADATAGLFETENPIAQYLYPYEQLHTRLRNVKTPPGKYSLNDDHEMIENWEPVSPHSASAEKVEIARNYGLDCYRDHGYCKGYPQNYNQAPYFRALDYLPFPIFLCDTRTEREHRSTGNFLDAKMFSEQQMQALKEWLITHRQDELKIITSPAALLPRSAAANRPQPSDDQQVHGLPFTSSVLRSDAWDGYPATFSELLTFIAKESLTGIVFVSGDFHFSSVSSLNMMHGGNQTTVHLIHCSGLYSPFPFANATPPDLLLNDEFWLPASMQGSLLDVCQHSTQISDCIHCQVATEVVEAGDGFCFIKVSADGFLEIEFSRHHKPENPIYRKPLQEKQFV